MIFQHTIDAVLSGRKTQTRRIVKPGDFYDGHDEYVNENGITVVQFPGVYRWNKNNDGGSRTVYAVGQTYAAQPGRGKASVARIRVLDIRRGDARQISDEDVVAEGFKDRNEFLHTWVGMHDKSAAWEFDWGQVDYWINTGKRRELVGWATVQEIIASRPAARYDAWALTFELVKQEARP